MSSYGKSPAKTASILYGNTIGKSATMCFLFRVIDRSTFPIDLAFFGRSSATADDVKELSRICPIGNACISNTPAIFPRCSSLHFFRWLYTSWNYGSRMRACVLYECMRTNVRVGLVHWLLRAAQCFSGTRRQAPRKHFFFSLSPLFFLFPHLFPNVYSVALHLHLIEKREVNWWF